jgi:hypothetical protein
MKKVILENENYRLTLSKSLCMKPKGVFNIEFIREQIENGEVVDSSTYQFFLTNEDLIKLSKELVD